MKIIHILFCFFVISISLQAQEWTLVWSEDFDGSSINLDNWTVETGGHGFGNQEKQYYTPEAYGKNLIVKDGMLTIRALKEEYKVGSATWQYTSGRIKTANKKDFKYGKMEARLKLPGAGAGSWPAFWMLGYGTWPTSGEIDIMEYVGRSPGEISCALHTKDYNGLNGQNKMMKHKVENLEEEFHTYAIEWTDSKIKFFVDGEHYYSYAKVESNLINYPFTKPFFFILNFAVGGKMGGAVDDSIFPKEMVVDYVRAYQISDVAIDKNMMDIDLGITNPVEDRIDINLSTLSGTKQIKIYTMDGSLLFDELTDNQLYTHSMSHYEDGIYLLRVESQQGVITQKLIKR